MLHFYLIQFAWGWSQIDSNATLNPGNRLFITWVKMTWHVIQDEYLQFIHFFRYWSMVGFIFSIIIIFWDTSASSQVSNCDGVMLENYFDLKFQWTQEGLNCESLGHKASGLGNYFVCKRFAVQTLLWSLEFVIQINLEHGTIAILFFILFLIGIHSVQGWTATATHGVTRKWSTKRLKHTRNLFKKNLQLIGVCWF